MKAILEYTDCLHDGKNVFEVLYALNTKILKTKKGTSIYPKIVIKIKDELELYNILKQVNSNSIYGIKLLKVKKSLFERIIEYV